MPTDPITPPTTHEAETERYETADPDKCPAKAYQGPRGEGNVGQRNDLSLKNAFRNSPIYQLTPNGFKSNAKRKFSSYDGENTDFLQYHRNFIPDSTAGVEYLDVRNKKLASGEMGALGKPATPFSPNVASPTVPEGTLFAGANQITNSVKGLHISETELTTEITELNPINTKYTNIDSLGDINDVGIVRRFTLGIGSTIGKTRTRT